MMRYTYRGDGLTDPRFRGQPCDPVYRRDGKTLVSVGRGVPRNQLVRFADGTLVVVPARKLRLAAEQRRADAP